MTRATRAIKREPLFVFRCSDQHRTVAGYIFWNFIGSFYRTNDVPPLKRQPIQKTDFTYLDHVIPKYGFVMPIPIFPASGSQ
jgi:hypothetical protein